MTSLAQLPTVLGTIESEAKTLTVVATAFPNGRLAILLLDGYAPYCTWAVNVPGEPLGSDEFFAKTYEENAELRAPMLDSGLFVDTGRRLRVRFVELEVWRLSAFAVEQPPHGTASHLQ